MRLCPWRSALVAALVSLAARNAGAQRLASGRVAPGQAVRGAVAPLDSAGPGARYDEWTFAPHGPDIVTIRVRSAGFQPAIDFGRVTDGGFESLGGFVDRDGETATLLRYPAAPGPFAIRVGTDSAGRGGAYTLSVSDGTPVRPMAMGEAVTGALLGTDPQTSFGPLYYPYYHQDWAITPSTPDSVVVHVCARDYTPHVTLGTGAGARFRQVTRAVGTHGGCARMAFRARAGRPYLLRVGGFNQDGLAAIGAYALSAGAGADTLGPVAPTGAVYGRIFAGGYQDERWRFRAARGDSLVIAIDSAAFAPSLEAGAAAGDAWTPLARVEGAPGAAVRLVVAPPADGDYEVRVAGRGEGRYVLRISRKHGQP